ncbi:MAG: adenylosuccinate synthase [Deltaproteobacteria bacterium]|nr:adenylosuccinate synthase [Deltaproteobacteria bacterium]
MKNIVVVGAQWGDEGKGKIVDYLSLTSDVVVRFQGGPNAGHTIVIEGKKFALHHIPSGIFQKKIQCLITNGVVVDPITCFEEISKLRDQEIISDPSQLVISPFVHCILPYHKSIDTGREEKMGKNHLGTTQRGIGPAYEDKVVRKGIRLKDLLNSDDLKKKLSAILEEKNFYLKYLQKSTFDLSDLHESYLKIGEKLKPYIGYPQKILLEAFASRKKVLFEGAQGALLDIDHGTYPFVTSSNTVSAAACVSSGIGPQNIDAVLGIVKAYTTRVGTGQFPTELHDEVGQYFLMGGAEFGTTTGRKRRCGWLDLVILRHARDTSGLTHLAITKLDILNELSEIQVCVGYSYKGKIFTDLLEDHEEILTHGKPVYRAFAGWKKSLMNIRQWSDLPAQAQAYLKHMEEYLETPIAFVSTSPERSDVIVTDTGQAYI